MKRYLTYVFGMGAFGIAFFLFALRQSGTAPAAPLANSRARLMSESAACEVLVRLEGSGPTYGGKVDGYLFYEPNWNYVQVVLLIAPNASGTISFSGLRISNPSLPRNAAPLTVKRSGFLGGALLVRLPLTSQHIRALIARIRKDQETPGMGTSSEQTPRLEIVLVDSIVK